MIRIGRTTALRRNTVKLVAGLADGVPVPRLSAQATTIAAVTTTPAIDLGQVQQRRWKATAAATAHTTTTTDPTSSTSKHLNLVTCALQKLLEEKAVAAAAASESVPSAKTSAEMNDQLEIIEKSWNVFQVRTHPVLCGEL